MVNFVFSGNLHHFSELDGFGIFIHKGLGHQEPVQDPESIHCFSGGIHSYTPSD